jgi:diaminopimelate epimerase
MNLPTYSGAGNCFAALDGRLEKGDPSSLAQTICSQENLDGLLILEQSLRADVAMRIFNRDGSEAEMCGNGLRCFVCFLEELGLEKSEYRIETRAGIHLARREKGEILTTFPERPYLLQSLMLPLEKSKLLIHSINTGVPHAVHFVSDLQALDVAELGAAIRFHPHFQPAGTNVTFVSLGENALSIRTYERGVGETEACGTGALAAALTTAAKFSHFFSPIPVEVRSKATLTVHFSPDWKRVSLQGPACKLKKVDV